MVECRLRNVRPQMRRSLREHGRGPTRSDAHRYGRAGWHHYGGKNGGIPGAHTHTTANGSRGESGPFPVGRNRSSPRRRGGVCVRVTTPTKPKMRPAVLARPYLIPAAPHLSPTVSSALNDFPRTAVEAGRRGGAFHLPDKAARCNGAPHDEPEPAARAHLPPGCRVQTKTSPQQHAQSRAQRGRALNKNPTAQILAVSCFAASVQAVALTDGVEDDDRKCATDV